MSYYPKRIPRASAAVGRTATGWRLVVPIWSRELLLSLVHDRVANEQAFPGEQVIRLPRRFTRPHPWPAAATRTVMPAAQVLAHVERCLRYHVPLPDYAPRTIGLPQVPELRA